MNIEKIKKVFNDINPRLGGYIAHHLEKKMSKSIADAYMSFRANFRGRVEAYEWSQDFLFGNSARNVLKDSLVEDIYWTHLDKMVEQTIKTMNTYGQ